MIGLLDKKQLGIYWGQNTFCFVEAKGNDIGTVAIVPLNANLDVDSSQPIPEELKFTAVIQKTIREQKITAAKVNLSLPDKEIIFRSFVIPWMQPNEVKNVVDFEATKYIPIKLEDLSYTYHPVLITEKNQKNFRILFVAARKENLEKYTNAIAQTGLQIDHVEPASVSLCRFLLKQGHISHNQSTGILVLDSNGKIVIVDQDVVQFVREFQLPEEGAGSVEFNIKLLNDIRVSFNYYTRQNPGGKIAKIIILSVVDLGEFTQEISKELGIPAKQVVTTKILKSQNITDMGLLNACGIAVRDKKFSTKNFDLSVKSIKIQRGEGPAEQEGADYKILGMVAAACAGIFFLAITLTKGMVTGYQRRLVDLKTQLGHYESSDAAKIDEMRVAAENQLNSYKDIRFKSDLCFYLAKIPNLLLNGTWLRNFEISYYDAASKDNPQRTVSRLSIILEGFVYRENINEQFRVVNNLVSSLKNTTEFASTFDSVDLVVVRQESLNNVSVTYFKIACK